MDPESLEMIKEMAGRGEIELPEQLKCELFGVENEPFVPGTKIEPFEGNVREIELAPYTNEDAERWRADLKVRPGDITARFKLVSYLWRGRFGSGNEEWFRHVLWIIKNVPESEVCLAIETRFSGMRDIGVGKQFTDIWDEHLKTDPSNLTLLWNGAQNLRFCGPERREKWLLRGQEFAPAETRWPLALGELYRPSLALYGIGEVDFDREVDRDAFRKSMEQYLLAGELGADEDYWLADAAKSAFLADEFEMAEGLANRILAKVEGLGEPDKSMAQHYGHLVKGLLACEAKDFATASQELILSAKIKGAPTLCSFGPNMLLAKRLLESGNRESVLEYFDECAKFWDSHLRKLEIWREDIVAGVIPDFGANLDY